MLKYEEAIIQIIEDDPVICQSLTWLLGSVNLKTAIYSTASSYLEAYNPTQYGCLLIDIRLPIMNGLQLLELLAQRQCPLPVIIITGHGDMHLAIRAMKLGAQDFISKPYNDDLLIEKIQKMLSESYEYQKFYRRFYPKLKQLTVREKEIMESIVDGKLNKVIASEFGIAQSTVELHRANIMEKLQIKSITELVKIYLLLEEGYKCSPDTTSLD